MILIPINLPGDSMNIVAWLGYCVFCLCRLEAKMRAEGRIIKRDYMTPEDRKWLEMDVEDSVALTDGNYQVPFYENEEWVTQFGEKP